MISRIIIVALALLVLLCVLGTLLPTSPNLGPLENIHGIAYPQVDNHWHITEEMAHSDVYLTKPVLAQSLTLTITFAPRDLAKLEVGIRENSFWLSYPRQEIYNQNELLTTPPAGGLLTKNITIPLTNKLADRDGSVDLMFFSTPRRASDPVWW